MQLLAVCEQNHSGEEFDGQDSSMVLRLIAIMSNQRHNQGRYCPDLRNGKGTERKVVPLGESNPGPLA